VPTPTTALVLAFVCCAAVSLGASAVLIVRIERLGARFGVTEAVLGLAAAVAADAPEITSAVTALARGQHDVGVGVVLGANCFQLAALLGLGALAAGGIRLDRAVVVFEGVAAIWLALLAYAVVARGMAPTPALVAALAVFVPYIALASMSSATRARLPIPAVFRRDVGEALDDEEHDIADVLPSLPPGRADGRVAALALLLVVAASVTLEASASEIGARAGISDVVLGGVVLAAVTSLPNLVAAIYLARRGRGAATLSEAMNSNRVNTLVGLLLPAAFLGAGFSPGLGAGSTTLATWYLGMTVGILVVAHLGRGLGRTAGVGIMAVYAVAVLSLLR
jgi:cation:H+ antiporter